MIVYFSGTGNSRYCAQFLAHALKDRAVDAFSFLHDQIAVSYTHLDVYKRQAWC